MLAQRARGLTLRVCRCYANIVETDVFSDRDVRICLKVRSFCSGCWRCPERSDQHHLGRSGTFS
eukprot:4226525-Pyramimonas_sp.AAC.1